MAYAARSIVAPLLVLAAAASSATAATFTANASATVTIAADDSDLSIDREPLSGFDAFSEGDAEAEADATAAGDAAAASASGRAGPGAEGVASSIGLASLLHLIQNNADAPVEIDVSVSYALAASVFAPDPLTGVAVAFSSFSLFATGFDEPVVFEIEADPSVTDPSPIEDFFLFTLAIGAGELAEIEVLLGAEGAAFSQGDDGGVAPIPTPAAAPLLAGALALLGALARRRAAAPRTAG